MEKTVVNQATEINNQAEEILELKQQNADLNDKFQKRGGLPIFRLNREDNDEEKMLLALTENGHQTVVQGLQKLNKTVVSMRCIGLLGAFMVLALIMGVVMGGYFYESYAPGQHTKDADQYKTWQMLLNVAGPLEQQVRQTSTKFEQYKLKQKECHRNFQNLLTTIKGRQKQLTMIQKNTDAEKTNFKLDKEQWLMKYLSHLYDFEDTISKHRSAQHDLRRDLGDFEYIKSTLHGDFRFILDLTTNISS